jgi:hypothetical protein
MAKFLRGTLVAYTQETLDLQHHTLCNGYLRVDLEEGQRLTILDELCQLTEHLSLQAGTPHTYVVSPLWATRPQYHPLEALPPGVGRHEQQVGWEQPLWWGGIVRDLHWHCPVDWQVVVSALEPTQEWWLLETYAGEILYDPSADPSVTWFRGELGALVTWEQVDVFRLLAILS